MRNPNEMSLVMVLIYSLKSVRGGCAPLRWRGARRWTASCVGRGSHIAGLDTIREMPDVTSEEPATAYHARETILPTSRERISECQILLVTGGKDYHRYAAESEKLCGRHRANTVLISPCWRVQALRERSWNADSASLAAVPSASLKHAPSGSCFLQRGSGAHDEPGDQSLLQPSGCR